METSSLKSLANRNTLHQDVSWEVSWNRLAIWNAFYSVLWRKDESIAWEEARREWLNVYNRNAASYMRYDLDDRRETLEEVQNEMRKYLDRVQFVLISDKEGYLSDLRFVS